MRQSSFFWHVLPFRQLFETSVIRMILEPTWDSATDQPRMRCDHNIRNPTAQTLIASVIRSRRLHQEQNTWCGRSEDRSIYKALHG